MTTVEISLCNAGSSTMMIWLEPWAQEFALPSRSELLFRSTLRGGGDPWPELEADEQLLTVWGGGGMCLDVLIDGIDQNSFSGRHPSPDLEGFSPRNFVEIAFGNFPEARPGGKPFPIARHRSWLDLLLGR